MANVGCIPILSSFPTHCFPPSLLKSFFFFCFCLITLHLSLLARRPEKKCWLFGSEFYPHQNHIKLIFCYFSHSLLVHCYDTLFSSNWIVYLYYSYIKLRICLHYDRNVSSIVFNWASVNCFSALNFQDLKCVCFIFISFFFFFKKINVISDHLFHICQMFTNHLYSFLS